MLDSNPRIHFNTQDGKATLNIEQVQAEDSGKYMCTARNDSGVATSSAQLVIRCQFRLKNLLRIFNF